MEARHLATSISLALLSTAVAHDASLPHYHQGKLPAYEIGAPSILLSRGDEARLNNNEALMQAIVQDDGVTRRLIMVKDVKAPPVRVANRSALCSSLVSPALPSHQPHRIPFQLQDIICRKILDIDAYPDMCAAAACPNACLPSRHSASSEPELLNRVKGCDVTDTYEVTRDAATGRKTIKTRCEAARLESRFD